MNVFRHQHRWCYSICRVIALIIACQPANSLASSPWAVLEAVPLPHRTSLQTVSRNSVHNGTRQAIAALHSHQSIEKLASYYKLLWSADSNPDRPGYIETHLPQWLLISRLHANYNIVVQLNTEHSALGSTGFISVRALNVDSTSFEHGQFADLDLLSSNDTVDGVDTSSLRVYASRLSVGRTHDVYKARLVKQGWSVLSDSVHQSSHVTVLSRGSSRLEISFLASREFASVVVVHRISSN